MEEIDVVEVVIAAFMILIVAAGATFIFAITGHPLIASILLFVSICCLVTIFYIIFTY